MSYSFTESVLSFVHPLNGLANKVAPCRSPLGFTEFCTVDRSCSAVSSDGHIYPVRSLSRAGPVNEYTADGFSISLGPVGECCDADCVVPNTLVEIIVGSSSSLETSIYLSLMNVLACADLPAHDDRVLDFSEDESSFLGLVDADVQARTTTNVSKDAESLVDESLCLGLVPAEMHTETTAHDDGRVVKSLASVFSTDLAVVKADLHIRNTVETDAIATSSVDEYLIYGSPVHDVEFTVLSPYCSVLGSLNSSISFFYPWHTSCHCWFGLQSSCPRVPVGFA